MIDRVAEELWIEVRDTVQEAVIKTMPKKKKCKKAKWLSEDPFPLLPYACLRTHRSKSQLGKMALYHGLASYL